MHSVYEYNEECADEFRVGQCVIWESTGRGVKITRWALGVFPEFNWTEIKCDSLFIELELESRVWADRESCLKRFRRTIVLAFRLNVIHHLCNDVNNT